MKIGGIQKFSTVDYPGYPCASIFTIGCNMRCGYCHNPELVLPEQFTDSIPPEDILLFLEKRKSVLAAVTISGGEPTEQADLVDFIRDIKAMGYLVKLDTNGTRPHVLQELLADNLIDYVAMDIKGPLEKYVAIAARPIDIAAIEQSIALIKAMPGHEFRTTIVRSQLEVNDFEKIGKLVNGAKRYALQRFVSQGALVSPQFVYAESFTDSELAEARQIMNNYVTDCVVH